MYSYSRILSSSLTVAALAIATPAFPDDFALYSFGEGLSSLDLPRESTTAISSSHAAAITAPALPDDAVPFSSGEGLSSIELRQESATVTVSERIANVPAVEGDQVPAAYDVASAERSLGADPFNRSMDGGS